MSEISTLYFIYGLTEDYSDEINQLENEFAEELEFLNELWENPREEVVNAIIKKAQEIS